MVQPIVRKIKRHGMRWEAMNINAAVTTRKRNRVDDSGSLEKFVEGDIIAIIVSWRREKSSMQFWRSRIFRKKSLDSSLTGLTVGAGAIGGPAVEYVKESVVIVVGGAGWRAMKEGMRMARRRTANGRTVRR